MEVLVKMEQKTIGVLILITVASIFLTSAFLVANVVTNADTHIEEVKCYDRDFNEILNQVCEEDVYNNKWLVEYGYIIKMLGLLLFMFGMVTFVMACFFLVSSDFDKGDK